MPGSIATNIDVKVQSPFGPPCTISENFVYIGDRKFYFMYLRINPTKPRNKI